MASNNMNILACAFNKLDLVAQDQSGGAGLGAFEEGSDEEDESGDEEKIEFDGKESEPLGGEYANVKASHFPQAFSHYTYEKSKKKLMVVDLQGVFEAQADGTCQYVLTDPMIHKRKLGKQKQLSQWTFGRTDRGEKGMKAFFETHECNEVCRRLGLGVFRKR